MMKPARILIFFPILIAAFYIFKSNAEEPNLSVTFLQLKSTQWEAVPSEYSLQAISELEASVALPKKSGPLSSYIRLYAVGEYKGEKRLLSVFVLQDNWGFRNSKKDQNLAPLMENVFFVPSGGYLPIISDGGCSVVSVVYPYVAEPIQEKEKVIVSLFTELPTGKGAYAYCNGLA